MLSFEDYRALHHVHDRWFTRISPKYAHQVPDLEAKGLIERKPGTKTSVRMTERGLAEANAGPPAGPYRRVRDGRGFVCYPEGAGMRVHVRGPQGQALGDGWPVSMTGFLHLYVPMEGTS